MRRRTPFFYGYVILATVWLLYFSVIGMILYGASVVNAQMQLVLGFDEQYVGLASTACTIISGVMGPAVGWIISKRGVRLPYLIGSAMVAVASFLLALLPQTQVSFLLLYGVVIGSGIGFAGIMTAQSAVNDWFDKKKSMAMAVALTAGAAGGFLAPQVVSRLLSAGDWTWGWLFIGGMSVLSFALSALLLVNRPADIGEVPDGLHGAPPPEKAPERPDGFTFRSVLKGPEFYMVLFSYAARTALYYAFMAYVIIFLRGEGMSAAFGAGLLSLISVSSLVGRLLAGAVPERLVPANRSLGLGNVVMGAGTLLVTAAHSQGAILLGGVGFGLGIGVATVALPIVVSRLYGAGHFSVVNGNLSLLNYLFGAGGPAVVGGVAGLLGGYRLPFAAAAVLVVVSGGVVCLLHMKRAEAAEMEKTHCRV